MRGTCRAGNRGCGAALTPQALAPELGTRVLCCPLHRRDGEAFIRTLKSILGLIMAVADVGVLQRTRAHNHRPAQLVRQGGLEAYYCLSRPSVSGEVPEECGSSHGVWPFPCMKGAPCAILS